MDKLTLFVLVVVFLVEIALAYPQMPQTPNMPKMPGGGGGGQGQGKQQEEFMSTFESKNSFRPLETSLSI